MTEFHGQNPFTEPQSIQAAIKNNSQLHDLQFGERKFNGITVIGDCGFSESAAVLVRQNRPPEIPFKVDELKTNPNLRVFEPNLIRRLINRQKHRLDIVRVGLKGFKDQRAVANPSVFWAVGIEADLLKYNPRIRSLAAGQFDWNINKEDHYDQLEMEICNSLGARTKTLNSPFAVLPTAPWDDFTPEDLSEYVIEMTPRPYACFRTEAPAMIDKYLEQIVDATKGGTDLPNSPWFVPSHQGLYTSSISPHQYKPTQFPNAIPSYIARLRQIKENCLQFIEEEKKR